VDRLGIVESELDHNMRKLEDVKKELN